MKIPTHTAIRFSSVTVQVPDKFRINRVFDKVGKVRPFLITQYASLQRFYSRDKILKVGLRKNGFSVSVIGGVVRNGLSSKMGWNDGTLPRYLWDPIDVMIPDLCQTWIKILT